MQNGFKVFDADVHVIYPVELWSRFSDQKLQDRVVRRPPADFGHCPQTIIDGREYDMWLEDMDTESQAVVWRSSDRWGQEMHETSGGGECAASVPILLGPLNQAVEEIPNAYEHLGVRCFWARPDLLNHRNPVDRSDDPIRGLLHDLDCAFGTHDFQGQDAAAAGSDRHTTCIEWHTVVHQMEGIHAVLSKIAASRVPDAEA